MAHGQMQTLPARIVSDQQQDLLEQTSLVRRLPSILAEGEGGREKAAGGSSPRRRSSKAAGSQGCCEEYRKRRRQADAAAKAMEAELCRRGADERIP